MSLPLNTQYLVATWQQQQQQVAAAHSFGSHLLIYAVHVGHYRYSIDHMQLEP
jgi:hypothetical protein